MKIEEMTKEIILIPRKLNTMMDTSIYQLLKNIGYYQEFDNISEKQIYLELSQFLECVDEWMVYSEDKRTDAGYFFKQDDDEFVVGYWSKTGISKKTRFTDKIEACASFIKSEIEEIRKLY